jgi:hypothetical protein
MDLPKFERRLGDGCEYEVVIRLLFYIRPILGVVSKLPYHI